MCLSFLTLHVKNVVGDSMRIFSLIFVAIYFCSRAEFTSESNIFT